MQYEIKSSEESLLWLKEVGYMKKIINYPLFRTIEIGVSSWILFVFFAANRGELTPKEIRIFIKHE